MGCNNDYCELEPMHPVERRLDGCFFRVERDGKWVNICFSDLTEQERKDVIANKGELWIQTLAIHLAERLRSIGDELDLYMVDGEVTTDEDH